MRLCVSVCMFVSVHFFVRAPVYVCVCVGWRGKVAREGESARFCQSENPTEKA